MSAPEGRGLLTEDSPTTAPSTAAASPAQHFSTRHRPGYARVPSVSFSNSVDKDITDQPVADAISPASPNETYGNNHGLGIAVPFAASSKPRRVSSPLAQYDSTTYARLGGEDRTPVMSPPSTGSFSGSTRYDQSFSEEDTAYIGANPKASHVSLQSTRSYAKSDAGLLSTRSRYDFEPHHCQSAAPIKHGRFTNWISIGILILAVFSTIFSCIFLILALRGPRYGKSIRNSGGSLTPSSAAFLTSFFAKMIELSFVTVVVAFVGQALARRAFTQEITRGVTLAEIGMRSWIMQPGTMFSNWESVRYAGVSMLGVVSLLAAIVALLYTTAATALVQPQLKWPDWEPRLMHGIVKTSYANSVYIRNQCSLPNTLIYTGDTYAGTTCLQLTHAAMAYHNFRTYAEHWTAVVENGTGSDQLLYRPKGYALFNDNTTITAPWIEQKNITIHNNTRYINNVTMAMPHLGVIQASTDPDNRIVQPTEVDGASYNVIASVPSPFINVLCVTMTRDDLKPFVYELWDDYPKDYNRSGWPYNYPYNYRTPYLNGTEFDDVFGWGPTAGDMRYPPVFPRLPSDYNTLLNDTIGSFPSWGRRSIYILGKGGSVNADGVAMVDASGAPSDYALCQLRAGITSSCSTHYNASSTGAQIEAVCEDPSDLMQYSRSKSDAWTGNETISQEWPNVGGEWARSISMNDGFNDGNASDARILTQLIVTTSNLSYGLPSMAEALSVLAGCTLIESITDSSFVGQPWNYTLPSMIGQNEYFNTSIRSQQYASGGALPYQKAFYPVLFGLFVISFLILGYFLVHKDWYRDFSEPATMFALTLNSPPSEKLAGSCGCGPSGDQYNIHWKLNNDDGHFFVDSHDVNPEAVSVMSNRLSRRRWTEFEMLGTPMTTLRRKFSKATGTNRPSGV